ncbi:MAG: M43 family zinc metalloprotease [Bacteroidia bacterium]
MKMIKKSYVTLFFLAGSYFLQAQITTSEELVKRCGTMEHMEYLKQQDPTLEKQLEDYDKVLDQWVAKHPSGDKSRATRIIPIVFHIVYNKDEENISDAKVLSQLKAVNEDFSRTNADTALTPKEFKSVAGNPNIQFCLATIDPSGKPTTGIDRVKTSATGFSTDDKIKYTSSGGADAWDVTKYYNIWIGNLTGGLLGYGEFPTSRASKTYGYVGLYRSTGTTSDVKAPYNKGRTTTHEMGHTFNLRHIWGDNGQCGGSDNVIDTPPQKGGSKSPAGSNFGKPVYPLNKGACTRPDGAGGANVTNVNGDMFMNYMDYSDDDVMNMFTKGQVARMDAVMNNAPYNKLFLSNACAVATNVSGLTNDLSFSIYPNPNEGNFNLIFSTSVKASYKIEINNALGQLVYKEELKDFNGEYSQALNVAKYGKGVYTVSILNNQNQSVKKLMVY